MNNLAREVQRLRLNEAQCSEIAADVERHVAAIATASTLLDLNDEPSRFAALLRAGAAQRR